MPEITITLRVADGHRVTVATTTPQPKVGAPLCVTQSLALDAINAIKRNPRCAGVEWGQAITDADGQAALGLVNDLLSPEMYGYSVTPEVRNAARRVLGIKGKEGVTA